MALLALPSRSCGTIELRQGMGEASSAGRGLRAGGGGPQACRCVQSAHLPLLGLSGLLALRRRAANCCRPQAAAAAASRREAVWGRVMLAAGASPAAGGVPDAAIMPTRDFGCAQACDHARARADSCVLDFAGVGASARGRRQRPGALLWLQRSAWRLWSPPGAPAFAPPTLGACGVGLGRCLAADARSRSPVGPQERFKTTRCLKALSGMSGGRTGLQQTGTGGSPCQT